MPSQLFLHNVMEIRGLIHSSWTSSGNFSFLTGNVMNLNLQQPGVIDFTIAEWIKSGQILPYFTLLTYIFIVIYYPLDTIPDLGLQYTFKNVELKRYKKHISVETHGNTCQAPWFHTSFWILLQVLYHCLFIIFLYFLHNLAVKIRSLCLGKSIYILQQKKKPCEDTISQQTPCF